jgi:heme exporter protein D
MNAFFEMGGYAGYVWPAYGVAALVLIGMAWTSATTYRRTKRALEAAQQDRRRTAG